ARFLGGASGRVAFDDEHLRKLGVADLAVRELLGDVTAERALSTRQLARLPRRLPSARGRDRLLDDLLGVRRVLLEELGELRVHGRFDETAHPRIPELRLRLSFELRVLELQRDHRSEALAHVLSLEVLLLLLQ